MYKSTNFLANHNCYSCHPLAKEVVVGCTKVLISQLITTRAAEHNIASRCCWMYKSTNFLANHNYIKSENNSENVVVGCTKVLISQLITTHTGCQTRPASCCWMYKSTNFLANHNLLKMMVIYCLLLLDVQKY